MNWFFIREFFRETSLDVLYIMSVFSIFYILINYARVLDLEGRTEVTRSIIDKKSREIKQEGISSSAVEGRILNLKEQKELKELERKRKLILERLPFFKN